MSRLRRLYEKAKNTPNNLTLRELCALAEGVGFEHRKKKSGTSHRIYKHPNIKKTLNFQSDRGKAKFYQVNQLLNIIDEYGLLEE